MMSIFLDVFDHFFSKFFRSYVAFENFHNKFAEFIGKSGICGRFNCKFRSDNSRIAGGNFFSEFFFSMTGCGFAVKECHKLFC